MDVFTQGALGAALALAVPHKKPLVRIAGGFGFIAGMAADMDVFIRSSTDPLLALEYHRQFTHALAFIPIGGLLCAVLLHGLCGRRWQLPFLQSFIFCTLGYATHALLDAATSYGTQLLWPFSAMRVSWSIISIVDPLFTVPLAVLIAVAALRRAPLFARVAMAWVAIYLTAGVLQHNAALAMGRDIAAARGHAPLRLEAKPSFANILVWKVIYETPTHFHVDAVRAGPAPRVFDGVALPKLDLARDLPWLDPRSQQAEDIARFTSFSQGFVAQDPAHPNRIIDIRYSFVPNDIKALWSIAVSPDAAGTDHARYLTHRAQARENLGVLWRMVSGR